MNVEIGRADDGDQRRRFQDAAMAGKQTSTSWRRARWLGASVAICLALAGGAWWLLGKRIWTDGDAIYLPAGGTKVRQIVWAAPAALDGELNSEMGEHEPALSPDGLEMYFARRRPGEPADMYVSRRRNGGWAAPVRLDGISSSHDDREPQVAADGRLLLFCSDRPGGEGGYDIWAAWRTDDGWGEPFNVGPEVNSRSDDRSPAMSPDTSSLYFASNRKAVEHDRAPPEAADDYDLFAARCIEGANRAAASTLPATAPADSSSGAASRAHRQALTFSAAVELAGLNTPGQELGCSVSPAGDFLYFASDRPGGLGGFDLYRARLREGRVEDVENLGPGVNSSADESDPHIAAAGFRIYFSSDREGSGGGHDLFAADSREVYAERAPRPLPTLGWNAWVLLLTLLLLLPLLKLLGAERGRNLLSNFILLSLLAHVLLVMLFSLIFVSQEIVQYVRQEIGMELPVNLETARMAEVQMQTRNQITDLAAPPPSPTAMQVPRLEPLDVAANAPPLQVEPPRAAANASAMQMHVEALQVKLPMPLERMEPAAPPISIELPPVTLEPLPPLAQADATAEPDLPNPQAPRMQAPQPAPRPAEIALASSPVVPDAEAPPIEMEPMLREIPLPEAAVARPRLETAIVPEVPVLEVRSIQARADERLPEMLDAPIRPERQAISVEAAAAKARIAVPAVATAQESLAEPVKALERLPTTRPAALALPASVASLEIDVSAPNAPTVAAHEPAREVEAPRLQAGPIEREVEVRRPEIMERASPPVERAAAAFPVANLEKRHLPVPEALLESIQPLTSLEPVLDRIGPTDLAVPEHLAQRSPENRLALVEAMGGSAESEAAVERALAYLARSQQRNGRWTRYASDRSPIRNRDDTHDAALTGLAALCFLAADHTPDKAGRYRQTISAALDYLVGIQRADGSLRGDGGNMYDHAMAALAMAEAAIMTRSPKYRASAFIAADYIVRAQNRQLGGWRYYPVDSADMSVSAWQLMALHSARQLGYPVPAATLERAMLWLDRVTRPDALLASYVPGNSPTANMTAQAVFSRILYSQELDERDLAEAGRFVTRILPGRGERDFYNFYCVSLMLMQIQDENWIRWNEPMRDHLVRTQRRGGDGDGSWDLDTRWGQRGGRIYTTSLATLTLQVYYRYLPMYARPAAERSAGR